MFTKNSLILLTLSGLFMLAANAADAYIDYDHSADFSTIKTFQMADSSNGGMGMATTTETTFTEGTLVTDSYTPSKKQMLWRGIAKASVSENPEKTEKHIGSSLDKPFEKLAKVITP